MSPSSAGAFGGHTAPGHPAREAVDGNPSTFWLTSYVGVGVWVSTSDSRYSQIGIQPAKGHTDYVVSVWGSNKKPANTNQAMHGVEVGSDHTINSTTKLNLRGTAYRYYSLLIESTRYPHGSAGISELSLIP